MEAIFCGQLEQAAGGGFRAAENSFLESVGHGLKQKSLTDMHRRFGAVERPPALLEDGEVEPAELGEFVRQASCPRPGWVAFHACPLLRRADIHIALVGIRSQSFSGPVQPRRSALTENQNCRKRPLSPETSRTGGSNLFCSASESSGRFCYLIRGFEINRHMGLTSFRLSGGFGLVGGWKEFSDLRALKSLHRAEVVEQARVVDGGVIPAMHRLRTVEPRHPVALKIMRMNV